MYYLYILQSRKDHRFYTGITNDLVRRLKQHNAGQVRSTKNRRPFNIVHAEEYIDRIGARQREKELKSYAGAREKLKILDKFK